jgi:hypothetical protein
MAQHREVKAPQFRSRLRHHPRRWHDPAEPIADYRKQNPDIVQIKPRQIVLSRDRGTVEARKRRTQPGTPPSWQ